MADYIVKDDGTATGDAGRYATPQTGSFAVLGIANYYATGTDAEAATTTPVAGDRVLFSDLHSFSTSSTQTLGIAGVQYICVDDANMENSRTSGNRSLLTTTGTSADITLSNSSWSGMGFSTGDNIAASGTEGCVFRDCSFTMRGADDALQVNLDGANATLVNCDINLDTATSRVTISNGGSLIIIGGTVNAQPTGYFLSVGFGGGGGTVLCRGMDMSTVGGVLLNGVGSSASVDDMINIKFDMCKLAAGVAFTNETFKSYNHRALFTRCSDSSAAAEYQYHLHVFGGDVDDDSAIFRNEDPAFEDSGQKVSYKIVTNSDASLGSPLWFDFPITTWAELSTATNTIRLHITSNTVLNNKMLYIEVSYPDATNKQTPTFLSSAPLTVGGTLDLMAAGTTLTTDGSSTWTGALSNLYQIDLQLASGADTVPIVKVYCTEPSITIQIAAKPTMV